MILSLPLIGRVGLKSMGVGAVATVVGAAVARPAIVSVVRMGYKVQDFTASAWHQAKREANEIKREAHEPSGHDVDAEIRSLRAEVASLKSQLNKRPATGTATA